jgi:Lar family restriction alleviation protein
MTEPDDALLPCPFCGERLQSFVGNDPDSLEDMAAIRCDGCGAQGPFYTTNDEAIAAWNRRAGHAARDAEVEALLTALHDAINSPKGVVPASAEPFYDQMRAIEAGDYKEAGDVADD